MKRKIVTSLIIANLISIIVSAYMILNYQNQSIQKVNILLNIGLLILNSMTLKRI